MVMILHNVLPCLVFFVGIFAHNDVSKWRFFKPEVLTGCLLFGVCKLLVLLCYVDFPKLFQWTVLLYMYRKIRPREKLQRVCADGKI